MSSELTKRKKQKKVTKSKTGRKEREGGIEKVNGSSKTGNTEIHRATTTKGRKT